MEHPSCQSDETTRMSNNRQKPHKYIPLGFESCYGVNRCKTKKSLESAENMKKFIRRVNCGCTAPKVRRRSSKTLLGLINDEVVLNVTLIELILDLVVSGLRTGTF